MATKKQPDVLEIAQNVYPYFLRKLRDVDIEDAAAASIDAAETFAQVWERRSEAEKAARSGASE